MAAAAKRKGTHAFASTAAAEEATVDASSNARNGTTGPARRSIFLSPGHRHRHTTARHVQTFTSPACSHRTPAADRRMVATSAWGGNSPCASRCAVPATRALALTMRIGCAPAGKSAWRLSPHRCRRHRLGLQNHRLRHHPRSPCLIRRRQRCHLTRVSTRVRLQVLRWSALLSPSPC